jgi:hypothetical protein
LIGVSRRDVAADRQAASDDHNRRETVLYAQSLERKALAGLIKTGEVRGEMNASRVKNTRCR